MLFPDGTSRVLSEPGYVLEKHLFERWLIAEAVAGGVEVRLGHTVTAMNRDSQLENRIGNWVLEGRGSTFRFEREASSTLPAWLAWRPSCSIFRPLSRSSQDSSMSSRTLRTMATSISTSGLLTHLMEYVWMIPKAEGRANVGLVTTDKRGAIRYLDGFIERSAMEERSRPTPVASRWSEGSPLRWDDPDLRTKVHDGC